MTPPTVAVEAHTFAQAVGPQGRVPVTAGLGAEVDVGAQIFGLLAGEVGPAGDDAYGAARLGVGWSPTERWAVRLAAGPTFRVDAAGAHVLLGTTRAWTRPAGPAIRLGLHALVGGALADPQLGLHLTLGLADRPAPAAPTGTPTAPARTPAPWTFDPDDARIWVPHPVCDWLTAEEFTAAAPSLPPDVVARAIAPGRLWAAVPRAGGAVDLPVAPAQGSVVLAAAPGDRVTLGGVALAAKSDGVYVVNVPVGRYDVDVLGGGRRVTRSLDVAAGEASWLAVREPGELRVFFDVGSAALRPDAAAALDAWVSLAGDTRLSVSGGASPEGRDDENRSLAAARALTVYDALIARGVPPGQLRVGPVLPQDPAVEPQAQRVVILTPGGAR